MNDPRCNGSTAPIRQTMRVRRRQLSTARQNRHARAICNHVFDWRRGNLRRRHIGIYQSFDGEIGTAPLIKQLRRMGARLYAPVINNSGMSFAPLLLCGGQTANKFKILEPSALNARINPQQIDLLLTPLTAFDKQGNRLGMGAGYYDRCFAFKRNAPSKKPLMTGLAHKCQEVGFGILQRKVWDVPLDYIATERGLSKCLNRRR